MDNSNNNIEQTSGLPESGRVQNEPPIQPGRANFDSVHNIPPEKVFPIIGVEFQGNRRQFFTNPMEFPFKIGDLAVVRVEKGEDLGRVAHLLDRLPEESSQAQFEVLRRATARDVETLKDLRSREISARQICKEKIEKHGLEMKLVDVEYQFDGRKLTFYFTADGRVDFRQLVKDLAATFRTRIELRQIGARDETKRFGGYGPCGRHLCCSSFIMEFCPITTQMAKDQNLPMNPGKISGCCGRLKCCLRHELDVYQEALSVLPRWDSRLETPRGTAVVEKINVFDLSVSLKYEGGETEMLDAEGLKKLFPVGLEPLQMTVEPDTEGETDAGIVSDDENHDCGKNKKA